MKTIAQLIEELKQLPPNAAVYRQGGEYKDQILPVEEVDYQRNSSYGREANTVVLK